MELVIPAATKASFPKIVALILQSESMDDEERQYWISVLPVMNEGQLDELRDILVTEKEDLEKIDAKYAKDIEAIGSEELVRRTQEVHDKRRKERQAQEKAFEEQDSTTEASILEQIQASE